MMICSVVTALVTSNSMTVNADGLTSGVASTAYPGNVTVKGSETEKGEAVGAMETNLIYSEPDVESRTLNLVVQNQIIRSVGTVDGFYKIKYGRGYGYVKQESYLTGDDLAKYVVTNPDWFTKTVKITAEATTMYDWLSGAAVRTATAGEKFQLSQEESDGYVLIYTETTEGGSEVNTLLKVAKSDAKISYSLHITSFETAGVATTEEMGLIDYACQFVGNPYVWGGTDPNTGADCSGFVQYVYKQFGYNLPRVSYQQATVGTEVGLDELQPGDLLFYKRDGKIGHVAIYIGDGQTVQARGKAYGICITNMKDATPVCARRILN